MKTKSYKDNNIVPKVGDRIVFGEKWFRECLGNDPQRRSKYDTHTIFIVIEVEEEGRLNYVCKVEHDDIVEHCNYHWLEKVEEESKMEKSKPINYKDNNIIPKVGDRVVFTKDWFTLHHDEPYDHDIFTIDKIDAQPNKNYTGGINYICSVSMGNINERCCFWFLEKVELEEVVEEKEKKEFTTMEQDMLEVLL